MQEMIGLRRREHSGINLEARAVQPIYLQLADDSNAKVRQFSLRRLEARTKEEEEVIVSIFRRHVYDIDPKCRMIAAMGIWGFTKDRAMIAIALPLINHTDLQLQHDAVWLLEEMADGDPTLLDHFAPLCEAPEIIVRCVAVRSMRHFGKRGVPLLRKAMQDSAKVGNFHAVKSMAIFAASELRQDGVELIPDLLALQKSSDLVDSRSAGHALYIMDSKRFAKPATWSD